MNATDLLDGLDAEQRAAVVAAEYPLAIVAAAGSGKTTVLTRRIAYRVANEADVSPAHVLALTFTNQAARELQRRLRHIGLRERVEAGTFHAVALRLLRQRAIDGGRRRPQIASDRLRLLGEAARALPASTRLPSRDELVAVASDIDWCRARMVPIQHAARAMQAAGRRPAVAPATLSALAEAFATVKRRRGVVDFDDVLEQCLHALTTDRPWAEGVRWRFRHLFVDEAQDLNPLQHALLEAIRGDRADVCLVGDPRQAIFGFNGADPTIMDAVEQRYPGITVLRLHRNYRCTPEVVAAGATVLRHADRDDDSESMRASGAPVVLRSGDDPAAESALIADLVRRGVGPHQRWRSWAVLARTTAQLTEIAGHLAAAGVPHRLPARTQARTALGVALAEAFSHRTPPELAAWASGVQAADDVDPVRARVAEAADRYVAQASGQSFRSWIELHDPFDGLEDDDEDSVELLTFHAAKGREWSTVVAAGVEAGLVPHASAFSATQRDEEARLLYVAVTRARDQLFVTWARSRAGRTTGPSPLIEGVDVPPEPVVAPPFTRLPRAQPDPVFVALLDWRRTAAQVAGVAPESICSDEGLRAVAQLRPTTVEGVAAVTDLGPLAAARVGPRMLAALQRATAG